MKGFFTKKEIESTERPVGKKQSCITCGLYKNSQNAKMKPYGNGSKGILLIGTAPNSQDDESNKLWQGKQGRFLQRHLRELGIDIFEDCISVNAVSCMSLNKDGEEREPSANEIDCCRRFVLRAIEQYKPKVIIPLGTPAALSIIRHRWKKDFHNIDKWRGWNIPDQDYKAWICPTYHPSFVMDNDNPATTVIWKQDLRQAIIKAKTPFLEYVEPVIDIITDLSVFSKPKFGESKQMVFPQVAIDYETTGLKPHAEGHQIVCAGVADNENHAFVFMMPRLRKQKQPFIDLLANEKIFKVAHNMKFEEAWSVIRLKQSVQAWGWDTMLAAHVLDNRSNITGLKFQTYVHFGIVDYDSEISDYLRSTESDNANAKNKVLELTETEEGRKKLMTYCALDAVYEYRLSMIQRDIILNQKIKPSAYYVQM